MYVEFSDQVFYFGDPPTMLMDTGRDIPWFEGTGTSLITFVYVVQEGDTSSALDFVEITCGDNCEVYDLNTEVFFFRCRRMGNMMRIVSVGGLGVILYTGICNLDRSTELTKTSKLHDTFSFQKIKK